MSFIGNRPKLHTLKYTPRSADPVNPSEGEVQYADGTVRTEGLWVYKNSAWTQVGSGSGSAENYIQGDSSNFEGSIGSWLAYADAAASSPVDGTGGAANVTITRITSAPDVLNGVATGRLTKDAANRQGQGLGLANSIDNASVNKPCKIQFNYKASANFVYGTIDGVTPSDVTVYIYDVTNAVLLPVFPNTLDASGIFKGQFQASSSTSYRVILHIGTTNASAWTLDYDNVVLAPADASYVASDSDWQSYTPSASVNQGFGTIASVDMRYRKEGPNLIIEGIFTTGTVSAVEARLALPEGLLSASNYPASTATFVGEVADTNDIYGATANIEPSKNYLVFGYNGETGNPLTKRSGSTIFTTGSVVSISAKVRIQGWSSGFTTADTVLQNVPATFAAFKNGGAVSAATTIPSWTTVEKDLVGAFNATTGVYTVKVPGDYYIDFNAQFTASGGNPYAYVRVNGAIKLQSSEGDLSDSSSGVSTLLTDLKVGDLITVEISLARTLVSLDYTTRWTLHKTETPATSINIRKIAILSELQADGVNAGGFTSGAWQTRVLNTEDDIFGIVTLTANQFVLQPGTYVIEGSAPAFFVNQHQTRLRNITAGTTTKVGSREYCSNVDSVQTRSTFYDVVSITVATTFELQHRCQTTRATEGLGRADAVSFGEQVEYAQVKIEKIL